MVYISTLVIGLVARQLLSPGWGVLVWKVGWHGKLAGESSSFSLELWSRRVTPRVKGGEGHGPAFLSDV